ncbi:MAG TPA: hypothetical protein EYP14_01685 [Planctomycetaceae bacterium]|nr:hypothetical protein [Planctomycetaceae bacterium]
MQDPQDVVGTGQSGQRTAQAHRQHELARQMRAEPLVPIHRHGLLHERFAALATDALRAEVLEICGYKTQVVEFIDMEHTAKNVLIRAVRRPDQATEPPCPTERPADGTTSTAIDAVKRLRDFKQWLGLTSTHLERALKAVLPPEPPAC